VYAEQEYPNESTQFSSSKQPEKEEAGTLQTQQAWFASIPSLFG